MLGSFLIGLREGLEASLVVGILVAYISRSDRSGRGARLTAIWSGVAVAVALSAGFGSILIAAAAKLTAAAEPIFAGSLGLIAVVFVTYMIFWMRRTSRSLRHDLEGRVDQAVRLGFFALAATAFVAVAREGLETALFLWTSMQDTAGSAVLSVAGAVLGLLSAVVLEYLLYRSAVRIDLARFFRITGLLLIVVVAGILAGSVGDLQEVGILPGGSTVAFDVSGAVPEDSWYGVLLTGIVGFQPTTTWLMLALWVAYLIPMTAFFLRPARPSKRAMAVRTDDAAASV